MKTKKYWFYLLIVLIFSSCATSKVVDKNKSSKTKTKYKIEKISEKSKFLVTDIKYPQFDDYAFLNNIIKNSVENYYNSFKMYAESDWEELYKIRIQADSKAELPPFEYKVSFELSETNNYISVLFRTFVYDGGNHGSTTLLSYNFDKSKNKLVNITQSTGLSYKQLSQYCNKELVDRFLEEKNQGLQKSEIIEWVNEGTFPTPDNYEIFMLHENFVVVYFEEYTVAPYVYGEQSVKVPFNTSGQGTRPSSP